MAVIYTSSVNIFVHKSSMREFGKSLLRRPWLIFKLIRDIIKGQPLTLPHYELPGILIINIPEVWYQIQYDGDTSSNYWGNYDSWSGNSEVLW